MPKPAKGKAKVKVTASGRRVSYGQAGKAKDGGPGYAREPPRETPTVPAVRARCETTRAQRAIQTPRSAFRGSGGSAAEPRVGDRNAPTRTV